MRHCFTRAANKQMGKNISVRPQSPTMPIRLILLWLAGFSLFLPALGAIPTNHSNGLVPIFVFFVTLAACSSAHLQHYKTHRLSSSLLLIGISTALLSVPSGAIILAIETCAMAAGIAVLHTELPSAAKNWFPKHLGLASATYVAGIGMGALVHYLIVSLGTNFDSAVWQGLPAISAVPAFIAAFGVQRYKHQHEAANTNATEATGSAGTPSHANVWMQPSTWALGFMLGGAISLLLVTEPGISFFLAVTGQNGLLFAAITAFLSGIIVAALTYGYVHRSGCAANGFVILAAAAGVVSAGCIAIIAAPAMWLASGIFGVCAGYLFVFSLNFLTEKTNVDTVSRVAAAALTIGYIWVVFPFLGLSGWLNANISLAFAPLVVGTLLVATIGVFPWQNTTTPHKPRRLLGALLNALLAIIVFVAVPYFFLHAQRNYALSDTDAAVAGYIAAFLALCAGLVFTIASMKYTARVLVVCVLSFVAISPVWYMRWSTGSNGIPSRATSYRQGHMATILFDKPSYGACTIEKAWIKRGSNSYRYEWFGQTFYRRRVTMGSILLNLAVDPSRVDKITMLAPNHKVMDITYTDTIDGKPNAQRRQVMLVMPKSAIPDSLTFRCGKAEFTGHVNWR